MADPLVIAGRTFSSRLVVGTGKYPSHAVMQAAHEASGTEMVTVAVRRVDLSARGARIAARLDRSRSKIFLLPNTAGCYTADDAVRTARLAREAGLSNWIKLEVIGDERTLFPDNEALLDATRILVERRLRRAALHERRSDRLPQARGRRRRGGDAARRADRIGLGIQNPNNLLDHQGAGARAGHRRRGRRHGVRRGDRDGARRRRRADEHRDRRRRPIRRMMAAAMRHARRGRPARVSRRTHPRNAATRPPAVPTDGLVTDRSASRYACLTPVAVTEDKRLESDALAAARQRERSRGRSALQRRADGARSRRCRPRPTFRTAAAPYDDAKLADINATWNILPVGRAADRRIAQGPAARVSSGGWSGRRSRRSSTSTPRSSTTSIATSPRTARPRRRSPRRIDRVREQASVERARLQAHLIQFLQTVTLYVDTKDRAVGGQAEC